MLNTDSRMFTCAIICTITFTRATPGYFNAGPFDE